jgi:hypothetical protein
MTKGEDCSEIADRTFKAFQKERIEIEEAVKENKRLIPGSANFNIHRGEWTVGMPNGRFMKAVSVGKYPGAIQNIKNLS